MRITAVLSQKQEDNLKGLNINCNIFRREELTR